MNLLERVIATRNEVEQLEHDILLGKIPPEKVPGQIKIKVMKMMGEANVIRVANRKEGRKLPSGLTGNMIPESTMFECPDQDGKFITRQMCSDFSGDTKNFEQCSTCKEKAITNNLLFSKRLT